MQAACNFIKKETPPQVFFCEFCEISKNSFSYRHLRWLLLFLDWTKTLHYKITNIEYFVIIDVLFFLYNWECSIRFEVSKIRSHTFWEDLRIDILLSFITTFWKGGLIKLAFWLLRILNYSEIFEFSKSAFWSTFERNIPRKMNWFLYQRSIFKKSILVLVKYPDTNTYRKKKLILAVPQYCQFAIWGAC